MISTRVLVIAEAIKFEVSRGVKPAGQSLVWTDKMPSLKIYPPSRLPNNDVTETQFNMWKEELEVYLSQEPDFKLFLPKKLYNTWRSQEEYPNRIDDLKDDDKKKEESDEDDVIIT